MQFIFDHTHIRLLVGSAITKRRQPRPSQLLKQSATTLIIRIHDAVFKPLTVKQCKFCGLIGFHGAVIIEMISTQISEHRRLKLHPTDTALLQKMRQAGIRWLAIGIESANEHVRDDVDKGYKPEKLMQTLRQVRDHGIYIVGNYIFGLPEDDMCTMRETLDFAKEVNTEYANFYTAMAYPGSALYRDAIQQGWTLPKSWDGYSQFSRTCLPLPTKHLSSAEVLAFRDAAFNEYFDRPAYKAMFARTFGEGALGEIERMVEQPLARDLLHGTTATLSV